VDTRGEKPFVIAGFLAPRRVWMEFEGWWNIRLRHEGLPYFHMEDCEGGYGPFEGLEKHERERLQRAFIGIINSLKIVGIAAGVSQEALATARDELSKFRVPREGEKQYMVEPYLFSFEVCVNYMIGYVRDLPVHEQIAFVFDRQNDFEGRAHKVHGILVNAEQYRNQQRNRFIDVYGEDYKRSCWNTGCRYSGIRSYARASRSRLSAMADGGIAARIWDSRAEVLLSGGRERSSGSSARSCS
jgi:hypothetical protein